MTLVIDLEDSVLRRKRGDQEYFNALRQDLLPRVTRGALAKDSRREQKIKLAKLLFSEEENEEDANPSEVYVENAVDGQEDDATMAHRLERLTSARSALTLSTVLREPACASLSLSEISKRRLAYFGKKGAEAALRCADKAIEIAGENFYDTDEIDVEVRVLCMLLCCFSFRQFRSHPPPLAICNRPRRTPKLIQSTRKMLLLQDWPTQPRSNSCRFVLATCACAVPSSTGVTPWLLLVVKTKLVNPTKKFSPCLTLNPAADVLIGNVPVCTSILATLSLARATLRKPRNNTRLLKSWARTTWIPPKATRPMVWV